MIRLILAFCAITTGTTAIAEVNIQQVTSDGGIDAWVVEEPSIPFTALEIHFD